VDYITVSDNTRETFETIQRRGYPLPPEALSSILAKPSAEQPHCFIPLMKEQGYDFNEPMVRETLRASGIRLETNEPAAVVEAAHKSGGVCLLAHPGRGEGFADFDVRLLNKFRQVAPVDGLEVYHPSNTPAEVEEYREYAQRNRLLVSAGSDSHKQESPPIKYRAELCRDLLERVGIEVE